MQRDYNDYIVHFALGFCCVLMTPLSFKVLYMADASSWPMLLCSLS